MMIQANKIRWTLENKIQENMVKLFEVEFKRAHYVTLTIEAKDEVEAEKIGLEDLKYDYYEGEHDKWQLEFIKTLRKDVR